MYEDTLDACTEYDRQRLMIEPQGNKEMVHALTCFSSAVMNEVANRAGVSFDDVVAAHTLITLDPTDEVMTYFWNLRMGSNISVSGLMRQIKATLSKIKSVSLDQYAVNRFKYQDSRLPEVQTESY